MSKVWKLIEGSADDGVEAGLLGRGVGSGGAIESHVVHEGEGLVSERGGAFHQGFGG